MKKKIIIAQIFLVLVCVAVVVLVVRAVRSRPEPPALAPVQPTFIERHFYRESEKRTPEFREPPLKEYRPPQYQQVGLLLGGDEPLPLYGKESVTRRNQWHYYTTTPGFQIYPLPVSSNGRDCMEDIGCNELYGNETLNVTGKDGVDFQAKIYRTENFPYMM